MLDNIFIGVYNMKMRKLMKKLYKSCVEHNAENEKKFWNKVLKKSLKHKKTNAVQ